MMNETKQGMLSAQLRAAKAAVDEATNNRETLAAIAAVDAVYRAMSLDVLETLREKYPDSYGAVRLICPGLR